MGTLPPPSRSAMPRVLLVGFSERNKYFGTFFHATLHKLRNGFIRAGSHVVWFSDRDIADYGAPFRIRPLGERVANTKLAKLVDLVEPDVICLMHTTIVTDATLVAIRRKHPSCRIISVYLDPLTDDLLGQRFRHAAGISDMAFATTAGDRLSRYADAGTVGFIPNPVDTSVERACSYAAAHHQFDFFFAGKPKGRESLLEAVKAKLPQRRFGIFLQTGKAMPIGGAAYTKALGASRIAVAAGFAQDWKWYASDRIAQYLGAGCLVAQPARGDMTSLYGDEALLIYRDADDLAAGAEAMLADDKAWRERARYGLDRALAVSDTELVGRYILDRACARRTFEWPHWSAEFYPKRAAAS